MDETKPYLEAERPEDFVSTVLKTINSYYEEVTITKVEGGCPYGHREGEQYRVTAMNHDGLCGSLYQAISPFLGSLHYGGNSPWGKTSDSFKGLCPEMGRVQVEVRRMKRDTFSVFRTRPTLRDMIGKGFPSLDKYRVFVEILGVERHCTWGHRKGQRLEVDPFNIGDVCANLYWGAYQFINLLLTGGSLPWENDKHIIHSMCPDIFNQTSYRLIREEQ